MLSKELYAEVKKMLLCISAMSVAMVIIFAAFGYFGVAVLLGALLGSVVASLNFLFLALAVEKSVNGNNSPKGAMMSSYSLRLLCIGAAVVFAIKSPYINYLAVIIPLIFPRIIIMLNNLLKKRKEHERT